MEQTGDHRICRICNRVYANASSLKRHIKARHTTNLYTCKYCPRQYRRLSYLNTHLAKNHGEFCELNQRQLNTVPNTKGTDCQDLPELFTVHRASSPINPDTLSSYATRMGKCRDINRGKRHSEHKLEGNLKTPSPSAFTRRDRGWNQAEVPHNPTPCKPADKDKIKKILSAPKKPIQVPSNQLGTEINSELFNRVKTKTPVFCPAPKRVKISLTCGTKTTEEVKLLTPLEYERQQNPFPTLDLSQINFETLKQIPDTIRSLEEAAKKQDLPKASTSGASDNTRSLREEQDKAVYTQDLSQPSTSGAKSTRESRVANNDCTVPITSVYHETFSTIKEGLDQLDMEIMANHQLGLDLLLSDSEDEGEMQEAAKELESLLFD